MSALSTGMGLKTSPLLLPLAPSVNLYDHGSQLCVHLLEHDVNWTI